LAVVTREAVTVARTGETNEAASEEVTIYWSECCGPSTHWL